MGLSHMAESMQDIHSSPNTKDRKVKHSTSTGFISYSVTYSYHYNFQGTLHINIFWRDGLANTEKYKTLLSFWF